ncbi:cyclase [Arthrobacter sp. ERGS1:01]|uniref:SRPBCC family protein n=1 Tax=Arthrobacter sp. ERGS1:01 TaxID=1704044 RepID=UPI0006B4867A|nr:SRPBCC family protein [Arthrobacter sp. ERGS1:01]ALE06134.1 cyclase [Arthrobacter sp. ERGS1:01]
MTVRFTLTTTTDISVEELFRRSLNIDDHVASMAGSGESAVAGVVAGQIGLGETVTWRARHFGVRFRMTSVISALDAPHRFVDHQVRGPFKAFHHEHLFAAANGVTTMTDTITFTAPFGIVGRLAERLVLGRYLEKLIGERNTYLCRES